MVSFGDEKNFFFLGLKFFMTVKIYFFSILPVKKFHFDENKIYTGEKLKFEI